MKIDFSAAGVPTLFLELLYSHVLFFDRDHASKKIGERDDLLGKTNMEILRDFRTRFSLVNNSLGLEEFPIYASRLQHIQRKMNEWRARNLRELIVRPYKGPIGFYALWFSLVIGVMGLLGLVASFVQVYAAFKPPR